MSKLPFDFEVQAVHREFRLSPRGKRNAERARLQSESEITTIDPGHDPCNHTGIQVQRDVAKREQEKQAFLNALKSPAVQELIIKSVNMLFGFNTPTYQNTPSECGHVNKYVKGNGKYICYDCGGSGWDDPCNCNPIGGTHDGWCSTNISPSQRELFPLPAFLQRQAD